MTIKNSVFLKKVLFCILVLFVVSAYTFAYAAPAEVQGVAEEAVTGGSMDSTNAKAISAAVTFSLGAVAAAIAMGIAIAKSSESIARQPEAKDSIRTSLLLGLIFIETVVIYALVIAIMIIFVL